MDMGSALDQLATRTCSRGFGIPYAQLEEYYRPILPPDWGDDTLWEDVYDEAAAEHQGRLAVWNKNGGVVAAAV